jgi:hypothetical protein
LLQARELAGITCLEQLPDQIGRAGEELAPFLGGCLDAEGDRQVRLDDRCYVDLGPFND